MINKGIEAFFVLLVLIVTLTGCSKNTERSSEMEQISSENGGSSLFPVASIDVDGNVEWGYIDKTGKVVIEPQFRWGGEFSDGLALVENKEGMRGYIDETGKMVIPPRYDKYSAEGFSESLASVANEERKRGYIDNTGNWVIDPQFIWAEGFSEGLALVENGNEKLGYIDNKGKMVIKPMYAEEKAYGFSEGLAAVADKEGKWGYINKKGRTVIRPQFASAENFFEGLALVKTKEGKSVYIDKKGKIAVEPHFDDTATHAVGFFSEGLAQVFNFGSFKSGFIDKTGKLVIELQFYKAKQGFSEGLAAVSDADDKFGYIDKTGNWVIEPQFYEAANFSKGLAQVRISEKPLVKDIKLPDYIDKSGNVIWEMKKSQ